MMEERISHAYLLVSPSETSREVEAQKLAQRLLCSRPHAPCGECRDCRKLLAGVHPDLLWLRRQTDDKGKQRREITVDQVRSLTADAAVAPNEAERKVYIIPEADTLNTQAQNALLKALEDPPGHACFILCTPAADALLPTVLSRLVRVHAAPEEKAESPLMPFAAEYLSLLGGGDRAALAQFCMQRAELDRDEALEFIDCIRTRTVRALCGEAPVTGLGREALFRLCELLDKAELYLRRNLSARQVLGLMAVAPELGKERT